MQLVIIPGWNEGIDDLRVFVDGRRGLQGFRQFGFDCTIFGDGKGSLSERIGQFADFLTRLRSQRADVPVVTFGYSAGGIISRGFLRAFPDRAGEIAASFQLGAPNAGVVTDDVAAILRWLRVSDDVIEDLDIESPFMSWLNRTSGHWESQPGSRAKRWMLDKAPWVAPDGARIVNFLGRMPRYGNGSDGVVPVESGTLEGRMPYAFVDGNHANHLNLSGTWNPLTFTCRRWRSDDSLWPQAVTAAARLFASGVGRRIAELAAEKAPRTIS